MLKLRAAFVIVLDLVVLSVYLILAHANGAGLGERINTVSFSLFPLVGAVLLARHPRNPVGYLVAALGMAVIGASTLFEYARLSLLQPQANYPLTAEAAWAAMNIWPLVLPCLVLILLLFPNGRLPGRNWAVLGLITLLASLPIYVSSWVIIWRNRHEIVSMDAGRIPYNPEVGALFRAFDYWDGLIIAAIFLAVVSFFYRFSRARGIERQQLKWFVYGISIIPVSMVLTELFGLVDEPLVQGLIWTLEIISIMAFPVVLLIAITRYRLYDIDIIIRRTLLYSATTLTLALIYFGMVLTMQNVFTRRVGEQPAIVIVVSTLAIAALFQPLRRRFQAIIDRRFYRSKYNAETTLERFATRLQTEVDLNEIERYFITIVEENIQPQQAELWLVKGRTGEDLYPL
jgi:hypothetical protein